MQEAWAGVPRSVARRSAPQRIRATGGAAGPRVAQAVPRTAEAFRKDRSGKVSRGWTLRNCFATPSSGAPVTSTSRPATCPFIRVDGELLPTPFPELTPDRRAAVRRRVDAAAQGGGVRARHARPTSPTRWRASGASASTCCGSPTPSGSRSDGSAPRTSRFEELSLPPSIRSLAETQARPDPRHRADRRGQDHDDRDAPRVHQPDPARAHRDDRGPDRGGVQRRDVGDPPARGRSRHRVLRRGAAAVAPPGPRRDLPRGDPRPRDGARRDPGRADRPPRDVDDAHDRRGRDDLADRRDVPAGAAGPGARVDRRRAARRGLPAAPRARRRHAAASPPSR